MEPILVSLVKTDSGFHNEQNSANENCWVLNGKQYFFSGVFINIDDPYNQGNGRDELPVTRFAELYEKYGIRCLDRMEGSFTFVIVDSEKREIVAGSDPIGIQGLYYHHQGSRLLLSDSLSTLMDFDPALKEPSYPAMLSLMLHGYIVHPHTVWKNVSRNLAGHYLKWDGQDTPQSVEYWKPPTESKNAEWDFENYEKVFLEVVRQHSEKYGADFGLLISGGMDSMSIAAALVLLGKKPVGFTLGSRLEEQDESSYAAAFCNYIGLKHHTSIPDKKEFHQSFVEALNNYPEPYLRTGLINNWTMFRHGEKISKNFIAGTNGDTVFGGFPLLDRNRGIGLSLSARKNLSACVPLSSRYKLFHKRDAFYQFARKSFSRFKVSNAEYLWQGLKSSSDADYDPFHAHVGFWEEKLPEPRAHQILNLKTIIPMNCTPKLLQSGRHYGMDTVYPFADRRLVEMAINLSVRPEEAHGRRKPFPEWFLKKHFPQAKVRFSKKGLGFRDYDMINKKEAMRLLEESHWVRNGVWPSDWKKVLNAEEWSTAHVLGMTSLGLWTQSALESPLTLEQTQNLFN